MLDTAKLLSALCWSASEPPAFVGDLSLASDSTLNVLPAWASFMFNQYSVSCWTGRPNPGDQVSRWMHGGEVSDHWKHTVLASSPWQSQFCMCSHRRGGHRTVRRRAPRHGRPGWRVRGSKHTCFSDHRTLHHQYKFYPCWWRHRPVRVYINGVDPSDFAVSPASISDTPCNIP